MKEQDIRKYHRRIGVLLSIFILVQVGSGVLISLSSLIEREVIAHSDKSISAEISDDGMSVGNLSHDRSLMVFIHHNENTIQNLLRIIVGLGIVGMVISGTTIFFKSNKRRKGSA
jgi:hypothetical protein